MTSLTGIGTTGKWTGVKSCRLRAYASVVRAKALAERWQNTVRPNDLFSAFSPLQGRAMR